MSTPSTGLSPVAQPLYNTGKPALRSAFAAGKLPGMAEKLREYERKRDPAADAGAVHVDAEATRPRPDLRRPAPRRPEPPLRLPARARRGARVVGGAEGRAARAGRARPRRPRRGSPARLRLLPGRDPEGELRRRHGRDLGPRHLRARRGEARRRADRPAPRRAARGDVDARAGEARRRGAQLAPLSQGGRRLAGAGAAPRVQADARDADRQLPRGDDWLFEIKWDGYRALGIVRGGEARLVSRNGNDLTARFPTPRRSWRRRCGARSASSTARSARSTTKGGRASRRCSRGSPGRRSSTRPSTSSSSTGRRSSTGR